MYEPSGCAKTRLCVPDVPAKADKADDLYRGSMQSEDHRRTALPLFIELYAAANNMALLA